jgi:hypothetical protein
LVGWECRHDRWDDQDHLQFKVHILFAIVLP